MRRGDVARVLAPAKLTTSLAVVGVRADGFHLLDAEMVTVSLADRLEVNPGPTAFSMTATEASRAARLVDPSHNLCLDALTLLGEEASIALAKVIPVGGGLGGGSADAAAVLRAFGYTDLAAAATLGSDVPFCVVGGRARVTGIGDVVEPLPFEPRRFCLIVPDLAVSTPAVYRAYDDLGAGSSAGAHRNDLFAAAMAVSPALERVVRAMTGRTGTSPSLAGSGSTIFYEATSADVGLDPREVVDGISLEVYDVVAVPAGWNGEGE